MAKKPKEIVSASPAETESKTQDAPVTPTVMQVPPEKPKEAPSVRYQRFSNIARISHVRGNLVAYTSAGRQLGDRQAGIRDTIIPLHRAESRLDNWRQVRDSLARNGDLGWVELGEIIEEFEARIKEAKEYRFKHNIDPNSPWL